MRLWSIHPKYLDTIGLVALWREALLAQKVLQEKTEGYKNHPQLKRFNDHPYPRRAIANYLMGVWEESKRQEFDFDKTKIRTHQTTEKICVTQGQLQYEFDLLLNKLKKRNLQRRRRLVHIKNIKCHPLFRVVKGDMEEWEK